MEAGQTRGRIGVSGASGLIGRALSEHLRQDGWQVAPLVRRREQAADCAVYWNAERGEIDAEGLEGLQALVHLAGENIAGRWTEEKKRALRESRVRGTQLICEALTKLQAPPAVWICASATGYYGDRGDEILTEQAPPGEGLLSEVCVEWEAATEPARAAGIRVVNLRIGVVLSRAGGALAAMLTPFRLGVGGRVGDGKQYMSWITREDLIRAIQHILSHEELSGPVNAVSPTPVTNREFTNALGDVLHRPTMLPVPAFALRAALGEMADALLLASTRVHPERLLDSDFEFRHIDVRAALRAALADDS